MPNFTKDDKVKRNWSTNKRVKPNQNENLPMIPRGEGPYVKTVDTGSGNTNSGSFGKAPSGAKTTNPGDTKGSTFRSAIPSIAEERATNFNKAINRKISNNAMKTEMGKTKKDKGYYGLPMEVGPDIQPYRKRSGLFGWT